MKRVILTVALMLLVAPALRAADKEERVFEMRTYYAAPHKLDDLHARFRDHTCKLFEKHGIANVGYWVPIDNPDRKLVYIVAHKSREAADKSWKEFIADPDWQKARAESEVDGALVHHIENRLMSPTDFSPLKS